MSKQREEMNRLIYRAYLRDGDILHTGEALLLACMAKTKGKNRNSDDMKTVQKIMKDQNLNRTDK